MPYPYMSYSPYQNQWQQMQQQFQQPQQLPQQQLTYVNGIEGARTYPLGPNSSVALFDANDNGVVFIKTTDGAGYATINRGRVIDDEEQQPATQDYVTRDELQRMYSDLAGQIETLKEASHVDSTETTADAEPTVRKAARR